MADSHSTNLVSLSNQQEDDNPMTTPITTQAAEAEDNRPPSGAWHDYAYTPKELDGRIPGGYMGAPGFYGETPEDTLRSIGGVLRLLEEVQRARAASIKDIPDWADVNDGFTLILDLVASTAANQAKHMVEVRERAEVAQ